jgi:hypothetical protein
MALNPPMHFELTKVTDIKEGDSVLRLYDLNADVFPVYDTRVEDDNVILTAAYSRKEYSFPKNGSLLVCR